MSNVRHPVTPSTLTDMHAAFESALSDERFHGYGPKAIPHQLDQEVEQLTEAYLSAEASDRELVACLPDTAASVLLAFAERQAALAVRENSKEVLFLSVVAIGLAAEMAADNRKGVSVLPLPWHSASLLGASPKEVFRQAAGRLPTVGRQALLAFCSREAEDQTLACMGYEASTDDGGFRYVRTW